MKIRYLLIVLLQLKNIYAQNENMYQKGQVQINLAFSLMPINKSNAKLHFNYRDGNLISKLPIDEITANYSLKKKYFGNVFMLGLGYFINNQLRAGFNLKPHLNSFLPNQAKNGNAYGIQFDFGVDYFHSISSDLSISFGTSLSRILGGFGITSAGPRKKMYLLVNGNKLYDYDIGFHIIDKSWVFVPRIGVYQRIANNFIIFANSGFQTTLGRNIQLNIAGIQKDGKVSWNRIKFGDPAFNFIVNDTIIRPKSVKWLPYKYSGLFFDFGTAINIKAGNKS
ncbi:MAG: hypothetical protein WCH59_04295 [Chitinophagia bacterium]|jgi:hypothetical protein